MSCAMGSDDFIECSSICVRTGAVHGWLREERLETDIYILFFEIRDGIIFLHTFSFYAYDVYAEAVYSWHLVHV